MDSYVLGVMVAEACFWTMLSMDTYLDTIVARGALYLVAFIVFFPIWRRLASERAARQEATPPASSGVEAGAVPVTLPDNITVYYRPAPLARRITAAVVDLGATALAVMFWWMAMALLQEGMRTSELPGLGLQLGLVVIPMAYFVYLEASGDGQTYGKRQAGIRAIHESGRALTFGEAFTRNALRVLSILPLFIPLELFCVRSGSWRQRVGDLAAGSVVVVDPR